MRPSPFLAAFTAAALVTPALHAQTGWSDLGPEAQIALAVQAAPADLRGGALVQGYDEAGSFVTLREGSNDLVCMAPNPEAERFEVSCHHAGLEAFFARGRELLAEGVTGQDRIRARWEEYEAGKLDIPYGSINYILTGTGVDAATGEIEGAYLRWTIYTPWATSATTGISGQPSQGGPWLMLPGTPGSHIMITPPAGGA
ncbi:MAG: hypothetical protein OEZ65_07735 [Gemmatimonadota bacterium]|nr:hypothetical protein [Gemmatimonadota bacterium]MDH5759466.1 hypothetical protein [Gemmatimonadota bacterium]